MNIELVLAEVTHLVTFAFFLLFETILLSFFFSTHINYVCDFFFLRGNLNRILLFFGTFYYFLILG